jgi:ribosomal protein L37AE/L43A
MPRKERKVERANEEERPPCEWCGSKNVVPILYGYPGPQINDELERYEREHKEPPYELGGCLVTDNDPIWFCRSCRKPFGYPKGGETPENET